MDDQPNFLYTAASTIFHLERSLVPSRAIALWLTWALPLVATPSLAATPNQSTKPSYIRPRVTCPSQVATLTPPLLRDLPNYINRQYLRSVGQRSQGRTYAVFASQPELEPLPARSDEYNNPVDHNLHQVFFTVLERQYSGQTVAELQHYHWLFLAQTPDGWKIALMFSRLGSFPAGQQPVTAPIDSSRGLTAQAIRAWIRDCQAGAVRL